MKSGQESPDKFSAICAVAGARFLPVEGDDTVTDRQTFDPPNGMASATSQFSKES
jgi:hypothetical protein